MSTFWYTYGCRKFQVVSTPKGSIEDTDVYIINIYTSVNYETVQRKSFSRTLKGVVQWIFLSTYGVALVSRNTLLFYRNKNGPIFPKIFAKTCTNFGCFEKTVHPGNHSSLESNMQERLSFPQ